MNQEDIAQAVTNSQTMAIIELSRAYNAINQAQMHLTDLGIDAGEMRAMAEYMTQAITNVQGMRIDILLW